MSFGSFGRAAIVAVLFPLLTSAPVAASGSPVGVVVAPARLDFKLRSGQQDDLDSSFQVANKGAQPQPVEINLSDVVIDKTGAWQLLPPGSTPYGFNASIEPSRLTLAVGATSTIKVSIHVGAPRPMLGGVLVHPVISSSTAPGTGGLAIHPDILIPLTAAPVDPSGVIEGVELSGEAAGIQLPMFAESGPLSVTSAVTNTANFYERSFVRVEMANLGRTFLTIQEPPIGTFPGGTARTTACSIVVVPVAGRVDTVPWFCICTVSTISNLTLLDSTAPPITQSATMIVAPWRLLLGLLGLMVGASLGWRFRSRRRRRLFLRSEGP
jgi:hypothetical protein